MDVEQVFRVWARDDPPHHAILLREASFEAAAIAFLEIHAAAAQQLVIIVRHPGTGLERCFRLEPDATTIAPCG